MTCATASKPSRLATLFCACLWLAACASSPDADGPKRRAFSLDTVAKTDVDIVTETHLQAIFAELRTLMRKLYRRNPREWRGAGHASLEAAVAQVFDEQDRFLHPQLPATNGIDSLRLAFSDSYHGDRVFAFIAGLAAMIVDGYEDKQRFYIWDDLDPQRLYNTARNVEIAVWKLNNDRDAHGRPYLYANETRGPVRNLSFERSFGKVIALQDNMARIVANKTNRGIKTAIRTLASAVFIPI